MSNLDFFEGHRVRTAVKGEKVLFALQDVLNVLGAGRARDVLSRLKERDRDIIAVTDSLNRVQETWFVTERGLIRVLQTSRSPLAEAFQDWADERVEQLLQGKTVNATGELSRMDLLKMAMEAEKERLALEARTRELEPKAEVYDDFLTSEGSYSVGDAAKVLNRAGISTGQTRLFTYLDSIGWTYYQGGERRIKQTALETGYLTAKAQSYYDNNAGVRKVTTPQVRVTPKGLEKLRALLLPPITELTD